MYNATASSNGLAQGGHRGLARVTALQGSANLAVPSHYESDGSTSESDDSARVQSVYSSDDGTSSSTYQKSSSNWASVVTGVLLAFCVGTIVGAFAYSRHERRAGVSLEPYSSELVEQNRLLHQQSSVSQNQHL